MKITIDREAGAVYIQFRELVDGEHVKTDTESTTILPDYTRDGKLFGIEILELSNLDVDSLRELEFVDITKSSK